MKNAILLVATFFVFTFSYAQPGKNDPSFNPIDVGFGYGDGFGDHNGFNAGVSTIAVQADGKIILGGDFSVFNKTEVNHIIRLNIDGTRDESFDIGTGFNGRVYSLAIQTDGKIMVVGWFSSYNGIKRNYIARLNSDGSLDVSFNPGTGFNRVVFSVALQTDGKIIVGGRFTTYNGTERNQIARLNTDGSLDVSFNSGVGFNNDVNFNSIQADGKIIVLGKFTTFNEIERNQFARLNADGSLDVTFNPGGLFNHSVSTISIQADDKIIVGGQFTTFNGTEVNRIVRLNTDGSLDESFKTEEGFDFEFIYSTTIQPDGKIILMGATSTFADIGWHRISRLNSDGSLDGSFDLGVQFLYRLTTANLQADGKIIVVGEVGPYYGFGSNSIARLNVDGSNDTSFMLGTGFNYSVYTTSIQADGKIIIVGGFTLFNGTKRNRIVRLNIDGSVDESFNPETKFTDFLESITLQSDGKIIVGGWFPSSIGTGIGLIKRLNADGSMDNSFIQDPLFLDVVCATAIQEDSKIILGGWIYHVEGLDTLSRMRRIHVDGSLDHSFNQGTGFDHVINSIIIQADGKIIAGGGFTTFNGTERNSIARINEDGSLDESFDPGLGFNRSIATMALQPDGKIIVGGFFNTFNGIETNGIARLNEDGSLDTTFDPGTGFSSVVRSIAIQEDGRIIVVGSFTSFNGIGRTRIARLNPDGSLDTTFNPGAGFNNTVFATAVQPDGNIIVGGAFTSFNGIGRNRIARLFGGDCETTTGTDIIFACDSYIWIDGNTYTENNNTATHALTNVIGCDSVVTLNLTMNIGVSDRSTTINDATISANNKSATYTWLDCDDNFAVIPGETDQSFTATSNGSYAVALNENGCVDTSDCVAITILSIVGNEFANKISLYPNPTQGNFSVDLGEIYGEVRLSIMDLNGKMVQSNFLQNTQVMSVSIEEPSGVYLINIQADGKKAVVRLMKE